MDSNDLHLLHVSRRQILSDIKGAEMSGDYALAAHLLDQFQVVNHQVRDLEEVGYNKHDVKHELAMAEVGYGN